MGISKQAYWPFCKPEDRSIPARDCKAWLPTTGLLKAMTAWKVVSAAEADTAVTRLGERAWGAAAAAVGNGRADASLQTH